MDLTDPATDDDRPGLLAKVSPTDNSPPLSVSELSGALKRTVESAFGFVRVRGEVSGWKRHASGHCYFTLKDDSACIDAVIWRGQASGLAFHPGDGLEVIATGKLTTYAGRSKYQIVVDRLELAGEGALMALLEQRKRALAAEGLFDPARKRPLPRLPRRIAIITSPSGAAIRDVISVVARRFPLAEIDVLPVPVQGKEAPPAIAAMIRAASRAARHDVILLTRGGGSIEDLWAFNDERVARAIHASAIPLVSAIGHEIDFTIADFVADLRAPTPSAAAELLVPSSREFLTRIERDRFQLTQWLRRLLRALAQQADRAHARLGTLHPRARLRSGRERLKSLRARLQSCHPRVRLLDRSDRLRSSTQRLRMSTRSRLRESRQQLQELGRALNAISPLATLQRGYAILLDASSGHSVRSIAQVDAGSQLRARVVDGELRVRVEDKSSSTG